MKTKTLRRQFIIGKNRASRLQVLSSGGGTQSSAMIVLAHMKAIPKPDIIVMADTGYEDTRVQAYQKKYIVPLCNDMEIDYVFPKRTDFTKVDIVSKPNGDKTLPPFFNTLNGRKKDGDCAGKQPTWCSDLWKSDVIKKYLNKRYGQLNLTRRGVDFWIGMSLDEKRRVKYPSGKWQKRYPLFESLILREQAIDIVEKYDLPTPPQSACWMCPNRHDKEWAYMKKHNQKDLIRAGNFERHLQSEFPFLWLHKTGVPIEKVDFESRFDKYKQEDIFNNFCDSGMCFI
jgi:hypothetical protein